MRADRLVQLLLFLQRREKVTVAQVAEELEISPRTARRDLEALSMSGVPVYSQPGRNGGWSLLGGSTTDLSGLTEAETRALFVVAGGANGLDPQLRAALRKLTSALPEPFRAGAELATEAIIVDPDSWGHAGAAEPRPASFDLISDALLTRRQVRIVYQNQRDVRSDRLVHPLGLIEKRGRWYMVSNTDSGLRTFRLDRVHEAHSTNDPVVEPPGFNLQDEWERINQEFAEHSFSLQGQITVFERRTLVPLKARFGSRLRILEMDNDPGEGQIRAELSSWSPRSLAGELSSFASLVRIDSPTEAIDAMLQIAADLLETYGGK